MIRYAVIAVGILALAVSISAGEIAYNGVFVETFDTLEWEESEPDVFYSDGDYLRATPSDSGYYRITKPLSIDIPTDGDLMLAAHFQLPVDVDGAAGGFSVALLTETDEVVAKILWYDNRALSGFGGLDFFGPGAESIYNGPYNEYPNFDGVVKIICDEGLWTAWVGDESKGALNIASDLVPTEVVVEFVYSPSPFNDYMVDYVLVSTYDRSVLDCGGDVDLSGTINVADLTYLVDYLFKAGPAPCAP